MKFYVHTQTLQPEKVSRFNSILLNPRRKTIVWTSVLSAPTRSCCQNISTEILLLEILFYN